MERRRVNYFGRVQGVGFRATTREVALEFPVTGWVRNDADGSVCLEVQGIPPEIEAFLSEVRMRLGRYIRNESQSSVPAVQGEREFFITR